MISTFKRHAGLLAVIALLSAPSWAQVVSQSYGALAYLNTATVARGGTGLTSAGIASFNAITGYTAAGATGTTSTNLVFSTAPAITNANLATNTLFIGTGSFTASNAQAYVSAADGLLIGGKAGSLTDFVLLSGAGGTILDNPNGTVIARIVSPQTGSGAALTLTSGAFGLAKMTASASAPGAGGGKLELVCGTNAGTAKLVIAAGTSGTAITITDNIGAAVTGC